MGAFVVIGLLSPLANDLAMTPAQAGWVMTTYALAYAVLSPLLVALTGRIGRRRVLAIGMGLFTAANAASALAPSEGPLLIARIIAAAGAGMTTPVSAAVVASLAPPEMRARALAAVFFGLTLSQVIGVPAGSFIAYTFGWRAAFATVTLLAIPIVIAIWFRVPRGLSFQPVSLGDLGRALRHFPSMLAVLFTASFLGALYVLFTYMTPLMESRMGFGRNAITLTLVIYGVGAVLGNILGGRMTERLGPTRTLIVVALAQIPLLLPFSALPLPVPVFIALMFVWAIGGWSFMTAQQSRLITISPETAPVLLALNAAAIYIGAAVGTALGSVVLKHSSLDALGIAASIAVIGALGHILWSKRVSG